MTTIIPTAGGLSALVGKQFKMAIELTCQPGNSDGAMVRSYGASLTVDGGVVTLARDDGGGAGLWVPYAETRAVIGHMSGSQIWAASGPFSGCKFAIGKNGRTGQVFAAHIAKQSGSTAEADYAAYRKAENLSEWYINAIPMPDRNAFSCSYVFAVCGSGGINHMARLDVAVTSMGGSDGTITHVHKFK